MEKRSVKLVGPGASDDGDLPPRLSAVFSGISGSLDFELLDGINGSKALSGSERGEARQITARIRATNLAGRCAEIRTDAVYDKRISTGPLPVDAELSGRVPC